MKSPELYTEGCNFIRHYSNCSLTVRIIALVQGLVILSAWGYVLVKVPCAIYLFFISLFGLLFTGLLFFMHQGYLRAANDHTKVVIRIEEQFNNVFGPVKGYDEIREKRYNSFFVKFRTMHATFTIIGIAFVCCLIYSLYRLV